MLKQITYTEAEKLINSKALFTRGVILSDSKEIELDIMSEPDAVNFSYRHGKITPKLMKEKLFDIFYHEEFQNDGGLVYYDTEGYKTVVELIERTDCKLMKDDIFYLTDGNMEEIMQLTDGTIAWFIRAEED